jgi:glycyl-tRNA synthetase beta chain
VAIGSKYDDGAGTIAGNERVLRARLSDAKFFWDQDRKQGLDSRLPKLNGVIFHAKLGLVSEKVDRIKSITKILTMNKFVEVNAAHAYNAAGLCKADLVTGMVGELPELQGVMGKYYALESGQHQDTADAIAEHYSPVGPNDACPTKPCSVVVALSDKIDTLVGFFGIDEKPSGSKDPFALRRAALGVIRLILENRLRLPLKVIFLRGYDMYPLAYQEKSFTCPKDVVAADLLAFFADRLKVHLKGKGVRHDLIDAVFALGEDDLVRVLVRVDALGAFLSTDDGLNLLAAYKRATNILKIEEKKDGRLYNENPNPNLQEEDDERALFDKLTEVGPKIFTFIKDEKYSNAMSELASARPEIDAFFDNVKVNTNQPTLRENRLNMLSYIRRALEEVADFSRIEG